MLIDIMLLGHLWYNKQANIRSKSNNWIPGTTKTGRGGFSNTCLFMTQLTPLYKDFYWISGTTKTARGGYSSIYLFMT